MQDVDRFLLAASVALLILAGVISLSLAVVPGLATVDGGAWPDSQVADYMPELGWTD